MTVLVVRHARAGRRQDWRGDDRLRPLSKRGGQQAQGLGVLLPTLFTGAEKRRRIAILSSPWVRCRQTVEPVAKALDTDMVECVELGEGCGAEVSTLLGDLVTRPSILCTHGDVVEEMLESLRKDGIDLGRRPIFPKGSTWVLQTRGGRFRAARYVAPPT